MKRFVSGKDGSRGTPEFFRARFYRCLLYTSIKSFERVAKKYNVQFAVKKDKTEKPPKHIVLFKGKDADVITQAFKEFVKVNEKKHNRISVKEKLSLIHI